MASPDKIIDKLEKINNSLERMIILMEKPENPFLKSLGIGGMIVGILGIIHIIDIIIKWVVEALW